MAERVVSLAPSATAVLQALGEADRLIGGTTHGDHDAPVVGGWLNPNLARVETMDPDLVIAVDRLQADIVSEARARGLETLHVTPRTLPEVWTAIEQIGRALDVGETARSVAESARAEISGLGPSDPPEQRPVVYCEEWSDPPMVAGNWVPDLVEACGGRYPFLEAGERSRPVRDAEIETHAPDHVVLHVCGHGTRPNPATITARDWSIPAIHADNIWVIDDALLNQPSPNLVAGARALHERLNLAAEPDRPPPN